MSDVRRCEKMSDVRRCEKMSDVRGCEKISHVRRSFICRSIYTSFFLKNPSPRRSREKGCVRLDPKTWVLGRPKSRFLRILQKRGLVLLLPGMNF